MKFRGKFYFLSNMFPCSVTIDISSITVPESLQDKTKISPMTFPCAESAFQAAKCICENDRLPFTKMDGFAAKKAGRKVTLRPDWENIKLNVMKNIVTAKFKQHPELAEKLHEINGNIQEENSWNDTFWGVCNGKGRNELGKILMEIRDKT